MNSIITKKIAVLLSAILTFSFIPGFNVNAVLSELKIGQYTELEVSDGHILKSDNPKVAGVNKSDSNQNLYYIYGISEGIAVLSEYDESGIITARYDITVRTNVTECYYGDVNNDNEVDQRDVKILQQYFTKQNPVIINFMAADMDDDNDVDIFDIIFLKRNISYGIYPGKPPVITTPAVTTSITTTTEASTTTIAEPIEKAYAREMLKSVNEERMAVGNAPLILNEELCNAAMIRAEEITGQFSHTRPDGTDCDTVLYEIGISHTAWGENIAAGNSTPATTMNQWINSVGHYNNIINPNFTDIGIGYVCDPSAPYRYYWVQMFIRK